jgi:[NiFe] hydrogenase maturation protein HypF
MSTEKCVFMSVPVISKQILIKGVVQGVGFRPFVYRTAVLHHISGSVVNLGNMVSVTAFGTADNINSFLSDLKTKNPPLSRIDEFKISDFSGPSDSFISGIFSISESFEGASGNSIIPPDTAICSDCLAELRSEKNRRFMYPFTVCTNCGPRYTTVKKLPYDRKNTTMDDFPLCPACSLEYGSVDDRRYHAQPTCCPKCGPLHSFIGSDDCNYVLFSGNDALKEAAKAIDSGKIVALKGDGGFHLVCDAFSEEAVLQLRDRLGRPSQPFAVMVRDVETAQSIAQIRGEAGKELSFLENNRRPIVVCNKTESFDLAPSAAPKLHNIGLMLPYSGTHYVLFEYLKTNAVIMTSANLPGLPMVIDNDDAFKKLNAVSDYFLFHNRVIQNRTDDTVVRFVNDKPTFLRRSRGFVPERNLLPFSRSSESASVGAEMNNVLSFSKDGSVFSSQYVGNTRHLMTAEYHAEAFGKLKELTGIRPDIIACDMHPDFNTTKFAETYAAKTGAELVRIQHHHAHICSVMADNNLPPESEVIGIALDGVGYGDDHTVWGGEILKCMYTEYNRLALLMPQPMPGGDLAAKYPGRMVLGMLYPYVRSGAISEEDLMSLDLYFYYGDAEKKIALSQLQNNFNTSLSSSSGRVLDAAAALLGLCGVRTYDGEPSMVLEAAAYFGNSESPDYNYFKSEIIVSDKNKYENRPVLDTSALLYALYQEVKKNSAFSVNELAAMFVHAFAVGVSRLVLDQVQKTGIQAVCLSGGVANNDFIVSVLSRLLKEKGIDLLTHNNLPPGDGCISHGQIASLTARLVLKDDEGPAKE